MTQAAEPIVVDRLSGKVSRAALRERAGLFVTGLAARALTPFDNYGFSHVVRLIRTLLPSQRSVRMKLDDDLTFSFPYGDGYWSVLLDPGHVYEDEVEDLLLALKDVDYAFIDCGANYGYWTVKVSSRRFGAHPVVAVELDPANFARLSANAADNGQRALCLNRAVFAKDDETLRFFGNKHEARSVVSDDPSGMSLGEVRSITLDRIVDEAGFSGRSQFVLKLDVEGVEIDALKGAPTLMQQDVLIIYEEHGSDRTHTVSGYLLNDCGMRLFKHEKGRFTELGSVDELTRLKTNRRKGYDFFATRSPFWLGHLSACPAHMGDTGLKHAALAH